MKPLARDGATVSCMISESFAASVFAEVATDSPVPRARSLVRHRASLSSTHWKIKLLAGDPKTASPDQVVHLSGASLSQGAAHPGQGQLDAAVSEQHAWGPGWRGLRAAGPNHRIAKKVP